MAPTISFDKWLKYIMWSKWLKEKLPKWFKDLALCFLPGKMSGFWPTMWQDLYLTWISPELNLGRAEKDKNTFICIINSNVSHFPWEHSKSPLMFLYPHDLASISISSFSLLLFLMGFALIKPKLLLIFPTLPYSFCFWNFTCDSPFIYSLFLQEKSWAFIECHYV